MTKSAPLESMRLMTAAMHARDDLRSVFVPVVDQVLKDAAPEHIGSLNRLRDLAHYHADSLRFALKDRKARERAGRACESQSPFEGIVAGCRLKTENNPVHTTKVATDLNWYKLSTGQKAERSDRRSDI